MVLRKDSVSTQVSDCSDDESEFDDILVEKKGALNEVRAGLARVQVVVKFS
jgi:hypothetical protein